MRHRISILAAGITVLLGGCASIEPAAPSTAPPSATGLPLPARAEIITPSDPITQPDHPECGDPTASLRPTAAVSGPTLDAIRARGRLIVGLDAGSNLFSFRDPVSGAIVGFDADIAREIARDLLGSPERIEYRSLNSADREKALLEGTVDLVAKTMTITCDRRERVAFSAVYLQAHQRVLAVQGSGITTLADLAGARVCVVRGTTSIERIRRNQPEVTLLTVPTWADCLVVLQQRQVDAVSTDDTVLAGLAAQDPYTSVVGPSVSHEPYGIGIPKGHDDLVRFVNGTLERIRQDGTWMRIYEQYLTELGAPEGPPTPRYRD